MLGEVGWTGRIFLHLRASVNGMMRIDGNPAFAFGAQLTAGPRRFTPPPTDRRGIKSRRFVEA